MTTRRSDHNCSIGCGRRWPPQLPRHHEAELRQTTHLGRRRAASRACRSSRLINQRVDRVPLCVSHAGMAFAADREAVPQCVQLGDQF